MNVRSCVQPTSSVASARWSFAPACWMENLGLAENKVVTWTMYAEMPPGVDYELTAMG